MIGRLSRLILLVCVSVLVVWAVVAAVWGGEGETISAHVRDYGHLFGVIPFAFGVLLGHWLGAVPDLDWPERIGLGAGGLGLAAFGWWVAPLWLQMPLVLVGGFVAGAFLWRMGPPQPRDGRA